MGDLTPDIHEQILARLDLKALTRCKSVCKPWLCLISNTRFFKTQLNINGHRTRIVMDRTITPYMHSYKVGGQFRSDYLVGSYDGLVCICEFRNKVSVANPLTREVKILKSPEILSSCWGFGYDSSTDDYKVIAGVLKSGQICFHMLTLKSNVWIDIGKVNCKSVICKIGTLCTGKVHWFMRDQNDSRVIFCFDLSTDKFKEIPVPDDVKCNSGNYSLGVLKDCLCIYDYDFRSLSEMWVMNNDDDTWKLMAYDHGIENHVVQFLKRSDDLPNKSSFCTNIDDVFWSETGFYISSPIYVQSLVSPHANERPKEKKADKEHDDKC